MSRAVSGSTESRGIGIWDCGKIEVSFLEVAICKTLLEVWLEISLEIFLKLVRWGILLIRRLVQGRNVLGKYIETLVAETGRMVIICETMNEKFDEI